MATEHYPPPRYFDPHKNPMQDEKEFRPPNRVSSEHYHQHQNGYQHYYSNHKNYVQMKRIRENQTPKVQILPDTLIKLSSDTERDQKQITMDMESAVVGNEDPVMYELPKEMDEEAVHRPNGYKIDASNFLDVLPPTTGYPLLFTGVYRCRYDAIKCLFDKKFGTTFRLLGVDVLADRWYVYVPNLNQAAEVILRMDKLVFYGGVLCVRYLHPSGSLMNARQVNRLIEQRNYNANATTGRQNNGFFEFSRNQMKNFNDIFEAFHKLPYQLKDGVPVEQALRAIRRTQAKAPVVIRLALKEYGLLLLGSCLRNKYIHKGWLKMVPTRSLNFEERRLVEQSQQRPHETWEPFGLDGVESAEDFVQYMKAVLTRFGPLCIHTHLRLRLLTFVGQAQFQAPATARELIYYLEQQCPQLVVVDDSIYDVSNKEHARLLKENMTGQFKRSPNFEMESYQKFLDIGPSQRFTINGSEDQENSE